jgi:hypothetical protein
VGELVGVVGWRVSGWVGVVVVLGRVWAVKQGKPTVGCPRLLHSASVRPAPKAQHT